MLTTVDILLIGCVVIIWGLMFVNLALVIGGYTYYVKTLNKIPPDLDDYPMVSLLIPAHNEGKVIGRTVQAMLALDYPPDRLQIVVINDNSSDNSRQLLEQIRAQNPQRLLTLIHTDAVTGAKGKSNALNLGLAACTGSILAIYDADNTPEPQALRLLVNTLMPEPSLAAVIGKFRTRNRNRNWLTRFINIETLSFQWMAQAGRWQLFKLCTIPGTNYVIRRSVLEDMGGWDVHALAEDTELSFRIYRKGLKIRYMPHAVTWEQEPQTPKVWFRQRTRWVKGNLYVIFKNFRYVFDRGAGALRFDLLYFTAIYFLLLAALTISDVLFLLSITGIAASSLGGFSLLLWLMAFLLFTLGIYATLTTERGELTFGNVLYTMAMYFSYCKMWMAVALIGLWKAIFDKIRGTKMQWYKTERF